MCGIVAARLDEPVVPFLTEALGLLEYRGYDSAGVSVRAVDGSTATAHTTERVEALARKLVPWPGRSLAGSGIGHTRWATHGSVNEVNAHPHLDCTGLVSIVHNGIIENAAELRHDLEAHGHVFASAVDSEVIAHLIEDGLIASDDLAVALTAATAVLEGSWAIVALDIAGDRMAAAAHRSPLVVASSPAGVFAASDVTAIGSRARHFHALDDGDVVELEERLVWSRNGLRSVAPPAFEAHAAAVSTGFAGFDDYMGKEIAEQPEVAARSLDALAGRVVDGTHWRALGLPDFRRVAVVGCGTSLHAGKVIATAFEQLGHLPVSALTASEAASTVIEPGTLVIALSQSGETADVLRAVDELDLAHSSLVALTNNEHSTLARRADSVLVCHAGPEIGVAATKTFVAQVVTGVATALSALVAGGRMSRNEAARQLGDLHRAPDLLAHAIAVSREAVPPLIGGLLDEAGFLFLGRGAGVVFAAEGALKLKELSYRWAEHYPAGELKHGPLALVQEGTPVIVIDSGQRRIASDIAEVEARGGRAIRIGGPGSTVPALGLSIAPPSAGAMDRWGPLEAVVPLQVLARDLALALGRDVDKPRNLAKSVTVE